ncbi:hypothetical protein EW146_g1814 [Bondarzewia mesenterica]|uniref:Uncharacterized protein n=1 Tax=Bondarzewia mesenterica TaxID=1095465 RepID=A0A4S4M456_9AGAM|nr:hypothetical protein EW146_g1814 [Bondarzewia mesenterica]
MPRNARPWTSSLSERLEKLKRRKNAYENKQLLWWKKVERAAERARRKAEAEAEKAHKKAEANAERTRKKVEMEAEKAQKKAEMERDSEEAVCAEGAGDHVSKASKPRPRRRVLAKRPTDAPADENRPPKRTCTESSMGPTYHNAAKGPKRPDLVDSGGSAAMQSDQSEQNNIRIHTSHPFSLHLIDPVLRTMN